MKHKHLKPLKEIVDRLIIAHLGTNAITPAIQNVLVEAIKVGERLGYDEGYNDAKSTCSKETCDCENGLTI